MVAILVLNVLDLRDCVFGCGLEASIDVSDCVICLRGSACSSPKRSPSLRAAAIDPETARPPVESRGEGRRRLRECLSLIS